MTQRVLDGAVGIEHDLAGRVGHQPDRQRHRQLAAARLGQDPALQAGADEVQLRLAHRALESEQQSVVEVGRVIEAVLVEDQRVGERADLQQSMPVGVVARQPRDLQAEHDPGLAQADVGDEPLEPFAVGGARAGLALVGVDHDDLLDRPAERDRALTQRVLALRALGVGLHLAQRGLAHVQIRGPREMLGGDLRAIAVTLTAAHLPATHASAMLASAPTSSSLTATGSTAGRPSRRGRVCLPGARPRNDAAVLEHRQPESPSGRVAAERTGAQLLIARDVLGPARRLIGRPRFPRVRRARARARPSDGAPAPRSARRSTRPARPRTASGPSPAARARTRPPRR